MAPCFGTVSLPGRVKEVGLRPPANSGENKPPLVVTGPERERERKRKIKIKSNYSVEAKQL